MAANYVLLERIELNASAASVSFTNIPQSGYTDLKVVVSARSDRASSIYDQLYFYFNTAAIGDSSSKYIMGDGASASSGSAATQIGFANASTSTTSTFSNCELYVPNYLSNNNKSFSVDSVLENNGTTAYATLFAGLWPSASAINKITFSLNTGNFVQYSTFSLYGLAAVGTTPVIAPKATGGNITTDGTYWYHTFTSTGTFTPLQGLTCDYLVVAGGGGGHNSGGGAGGFRTTTNQSVATTSYTVTVGAGGAGYVNGSPTSANGNNSSFNSFSATGGGKGVADGTAGGNGGSGGGGATGGGAGTGNAGSYTPVEGYNGGSGSGYSGGGGAGGAGGNTSSQSTGGNGGIGAYTTLTNAMASATSTGVLSGGNYYFAGGGGGCATTTQGTGGLGGGGAAGYGQATPGTINTGGGAGGTYTGGTTPLNGGSGIVIIRYTIA